MLALALFANHGTISSLWPETLTYGLLVYFVVRNFRISNDLAGNVEEVEAVQDVPSIEETARLFIRNLPYGATEADLAEAFREHGEISEVHLVLDRCVMPGSGLCESLLNTILKWNLGRGLQVVRRR